MIKLFEYEGKSLLAACGIAIPAGGLYRALPPDLQGPLVVKVQVLAGGRGKAGGIRFAGTREEAEHVAAQMVGTRLGEAVIGEVYVEQRLDIAREFYVAALVDRDLGMPVLLASTAGGVDIESVPAELIVRQRIDPLLGLQPFMVERVVRGMQLESAQAAMFAEVLRCVYDALVSQDAELVEINPLVLTAGGALVAADAKLLLDEDAAFRHPGRRAKPDGTTFEMAARGLDVIGVETGPPGGIAAIMNGAGLTMATLDELIALGGTVSGVVELHGATAQGPDHIAEVIGCVLRELDPAVILVNIHFQFRNLATIAEGVVGALHRFPTLTPERLVLRMRGEKQEEAAQILAASGAAMLQEFAPACAAAVQRAQQNAR